jgi:hypothetical protein
LNEILIGRDGRDGRDGRHRRHRSIGGPDIGQINSDALPEGLNVRPVERERRGAGRRRALVLEGEEAGHTDGFLLGKTENTSDRFQERQVFLEIDVVLIIYHDDFMNAIVTTIDRKEWGAVNADGGNEVQFLEDATLRGNDLGESEKFHLETLIRRWFRLIRDS